MLMFWFTAYITLWSAHRIETFESYCKDYNTKYTDVTKEAGLILVETVNLLMSLQTLNIDRYSLEPFIVTRNIFGEDPTIAVVQLESIFKVNIKVQKLANNDFHTSLYYRT